MDHLQKAQNLVELEGYSINSSPGIAAIAHALIAIAERLDRLIDNQGQVMNVPVTGVLCGDKKVFEAD